MKKMIAVMLLVASLTLVSGQVYASTVLDTNIIAIVVNKLNIVFSNNEKHIDDYFNNKEQEQKDDLIGHIDDKNSEYNDYLENIKNEGIAESETELNQYLNELKAEIDSLYEAQKQNATDELNNKFNQETLRIKLELLAILEAMYK